MAEDGAWHGSYSETSCLNNESSDSDEFVSEDLPFFNDSKVCSSVTTASDSPQRAMVPTQQPTLPNNPVEDSLHQDRLRCIAALKQWCKENPNCEGNTAMSLDTQAATTLYPDPNHVEAHCGNLLTLVYAQLFPTDLVELFADTYESCKADQPFVWPLNWRRPFRATPSRVQYIKAKNFMPFQPKRAREPVQNDIAHRRHAVWKKVNKRAADRRHVQNKRAKWRKPAASKASPVCKKCYEKPRTHKDLGFRPIGAVQTPDFKGVAFTCEQHGTQHSYLLGPSGGKNAPTALSPTLRPFLEHGFVVRQMPPDGDCFYHCVVDALADLEIVSSVRSLRAKVKKSMCVHQWELLRTLHASACAPPTNRKGGETPAWALKYDIYRAQIPYCKHDIGEGECIQADAVEIALLSNMYNLAFLKVDMHSIVKGTKWWEKTWPFEIHYGSRVRLDKCHFVMLKYGEPKGAKGEFHYDCIEHKDTKKLVFKGYAELPAVVKNMFFVSSEVESQIVKFSAQEMAKIVSHSNSKPTTASSA